MEKTIELFFDDEAAIVSKNMGGAISNMQVEPLTSFYPEVGPNLHLLWRKLRAAFDPQGICAPGRQVFTEEELKEFPRQMADWINKGRTAHRMKAIDREDLIRG